MFETQATDKILTLVSVLFLLFAEINANYLRTYGLQDVYNTTEADTPTPKVMSSLKKFGNGYYYFETTFEGNYFQALQFCNHRGMNLLSVESKEEQQFVTRNLQALFGRQSYYFWTSGTILPNNHWVWLSTGKPFVYTDWMPKEPNNSGKEEKCLELRYATHNKDPMWNDARCSGLSSRLRTPICEIEITENIYNCNEETEGTPYSLPLEEFGDKYYYFGVAYEGNYFQALQYCNYHGMDLLSIETEEEQDFVVKRIQSKYGTQEYAFWTSGTTLPSKRWIWLATGEPIIFTNWRPNQPDNYKNNEHCLELRYKENNKNLSWNDHNCADAKCVICETKPKENELKLISDSFNFTLQTADVIEV